ncbi:MAG: transposase [Hyphomicrobiaceae bacterium]
MGQVAVYSSVERRRRWSDEERLQILGEAFSPGACVSQVARRHDVSTGLIYTWRRKLCEAGTGPEGLEAAEPGFAEAMVVDDGDGRPAEQAPTMVIDLARGRRVSIFSSASPALVGAALKALR